MLTVTNNELTSVQQAVKDSGLKHIAIIMDGNRRWAKKHFRPTAYGHKAGVKTLKKIVKYLDEINVKYLTVYAFSTENWGRKKEEVEFLMFLLGETIKNELQELHEKNIKINFVGDLSKFSKELKEIFENAADFTKNNTGVNLNIAVNYGARDEITRAIKTIAKKVKASELAIDDITEDLISNHLDTSGMPSPDVLIRTGGDMRVSNFLLWQIAYSEITVTETLWPDFSEKELNETILDFAQRDRRFGKG